MSVAEQIQNYYAQNQALMQPIAGAKTQQGSVTTAGRGRELPRHQVYHLIYDADGRVVNYHSDFWTLDMNGLFSKLSTVYPPGTAGEGKPVWVLPPQLPEGATKPQLTIPCGYPGCPWKGDTEESVMVHMRGYHPEFTQLEEERKSREKSDETLAALNKLVTLLAADNLQKGQQTEDMLAEIKEMLLGTGDKKRRKEV